MQHFQFKLLLTCLFAVIRVCWANNSTAGNCTVVEFDPPTKVIVNSSVEISCAAHVQPPTLNSQEAGCIGYVIDLVFKAVGSDMENSLGGQAVMCNESRCWKSIWISFEQKYDGAVFYCRLLSITSGSQASVYSKAKYIQVITVIDNVTQLDSRISPNVITINWTKPESLSSIHPNYSVAVIQNITVVITSDTNSTEVTFDTSSVNTNPCIPIVIRITTSAGNLPPNTSIFILHRHFLASPVITNVSYSTQRNLIRDPNDINITFTIEELQHCPGRSATTVHVLVAGIEHHFPITIRNSTIQQTISLPAHNVYNASLWLENRVGHSEQIQVQQINLRLIEGGSLQMKDRAPCVKCHFSHLSRSGDMCHIDISISATGYHEEDTIQLTGHSNPEYCFSVLAPGNHTVTVAINDVGGDGEPHVFKKDVYVQDKAFGTNFGVLIGIPVGVTAIVILMILVIVIAASFKFRSLRRNYCMQSERMRSERNQFAESILETTFIRDTTEPQTEITHLPEDNNEGFTDHTELNFRQPQEVSNVEEQNLAATRKFVTGLKAANNNHTETAEHTQKTSISIDEADEFELLLKPTPTKGKGFSSQNDTPSLATSTTPGLEEQMRPEERSIGHNESENSQQEMISGPTSFVRQVSTQDTGTEDDVVAQQLVMTSISSLKSMTSDNGANSVQTCLQIEGTEEIPPSPASEETDRSRRLAEATASQEGKVKQDIEESSVCSEFSNVKVDIITGQGSHRQQQKATNLEAPERIEHDSLSPDAITSAPKLLRQLSGGLDTLQEGVVDTDKETVGKEILSSNADNQKEVSDNENSVQQDLQEITTTPAEVSTQGAGPEEQVMVHHRALHRRTSVTIAPSEEQLSTEQPTNQCTQEQFKSVLANSQEESACVKPCE